MICSQDPSKFWHNWTLLVPTVCGVSLLSQRVALSHVYYPMKTDSGEEEFCSTHHFCTQKTPDFSDLSFMDNLYFRDVNPRHSEVPRYSWGWVRSKERGRTKEAWASMHDNSIMVLTRQIKPCVKDLVTSAGFRRWEFGIQNLNSCFLSFCTRASLEEQNG